VAIHRPVPLDGHAPQLAQGAGLDGAVRGAVAAARAFVASGGAAGGRLLYRSPASAVRLLQ